MLSSSTESTRISIKHHFIRSLFISYASDLRGFIAVKFGDPSNAEDIVQDAFQNLMGMDAPETIEDPKAYLYKAARNLALNRIRKQKHHESYISSQDHNEQYLPPERSVHATIDLEKTQAGIDKLPPKYQKAFLMSRVHAKTYNEISAELGVSVSTVEKYIITTLKFLREQLDRNG
ncbi:MAG: sigma-70 family RNA polymerase sigma factor [Agarilytica sp.]